MAKYLKITKSSVYKRIQFLKRNCYIKKSRSFGGGTTQKVTQNKNPIRLHGQQWQIKILYKSSLYLEYLKKSNYINFKSFKCRLYKNSLTLWVLIDFVSNDPDSAHLESTNFLHGCLLKLENRLGLCLIKSGYQNLKEVKAHYAETNNEIAKEYNQKKKRLSIKAPEDLKEWLHIDNSLNLNEMEFTHSETANPDTNNICDQMNFLRSNPKLLQLLLKNMVLIQDYIIKNEKNKGEK